MQKENFLSRHPLIKQLLLMLGMSVIIITLGFLFLRIYSRHGQEYEVPNLIGKNASEIENIKEARRFECLLIDSVFLDGKKGGDILTQDPPAGSKAKKGRKIYLSIAAYNPENTEVPNLIDLTLRQAISQLEAAGLQGGRLTYVNDIARNAILKQTTKGRIIKAGQKVPKGSFIDLTVGLGETPKGATVPLVIGRTAHQARRSILSASLNVGTEHFPNNIDRTTAKVYKQSPAYSGADAAMPLGGKVELWYAAPDAKNYNQLAGKSKADAAASEKENEEE